MEKRIFILGAQGRLGSELYRLWNNKKPSLGLDSVIGLGRADLDLADPLGAVEALKKQSLQTGDVIVNSAAITDVDRCEKEQALATIVNATTPGLLAEHAAQCGSRFVHLSTDYIFDGLSKTPYLEEDRPSPLGHYGASKLEAEKLVLAASSEHVIARVSWVFGPDRASFIDQIIKTALTTSEVGAVHDKISSPTYTKDLASWLISFFDPKISGGIYHLCNQGVCSWKEYAEYALQTAKRYGINVQTTSVTPLTMKEITRFISPRPPFTPLNTGKFSTSTNVVLRPWQEAVEDYIKNFNYLYS